MIQARFHQIDRARAAGSNASCPQAIVALLCWILSLASMTLRPTTQMIAFLPRFTWPRGARFSSLIHMPRAWLAMIALVMFLPTAANAACGTLNVPNGSTSPATSPMASGGTITVTTSCDPFGLNLYPDTQAPGFSSPPSHGSITITNSNAGIFTYTNNGDGATSDSFVLTDASNNEFTVNVAIAAPTSSIVISPNALSAMQAGASFSQSLSATGGTAPYTFTLDSGSLPPGLSLSGNTISGTPTQRGSYNFAVKATDNTGATQVKSYTGTVAVPNLTLSPSSAQGSVGTAFSVTYAPGGGVAPYYNPALEVGATVPPGLTLSGFTLSGTPTTTGTYSFRIVYYDSSTGIGTYFQYVPVTVTIVAAPPSISTVTPANGPTAGGTSVTIAGTGFTGATAVTFDGVSAASFSVGSDTSITATTPAHAAGAVTVAVTTATSGTVSKPSGFTYTPPAPVANPVSATVAYNSTNNPITLNLTGGAPTSVAVGTPAAHGTATAAGTSITYTPTAGYAGPDSFSYTATNAGGTSAPATATITVSPPTITYTPANPPAGTVGVAYNPSIAGASGGASPYTYALVSGSYPPGVTLNANGSFSGTPTTAGTFSFNVRATDSSTGTGPFSSTPANVSVTINAAAPTISSVTPNSGSTAGGTAVTVTGTGFTGATTVTFGGAAATAVTVVNDTTITATTPAHATGAVAVDVTAPGGTANLPNGFTYNAAAPTIGGVVPNSGPAAGGTVVTITGTGFTGATAVTFGGTPATGVTVVSDTSITATTPAHAAGAVAVAVTAPGGNASLPNGFTYSAPVPTVASVSPNNGTTLGGTGVTITGTGFTGATAVNFGATPATGVTVVNDTTITATTPAHAAGSVAVAVTTPGGTGSLPNGFTYNASAPTISAVAPSSGPAAGGTAVTITGTGLTGATAITFGGTAATGITVVNDTTITATTPAHAAGAVAVAVTAPGGNASLPNGFTYAPPVPTVASVAPNTGSTLGGTAVTITGTGLTGATAVSFGGTAATGITVVNDTTITATTPAHAGGAVAVAVTAPGGNASLPNGFTYTAPVPTVASVAPNTGAASGGTAVTITGTGFTGATAVTFGGTPATGVTVVNDTTITATTPAHAGGAVAVAVTAPGGNAFLPNGFTYTAAVPTLASVSPNNGSTPGGTAVTITGTGFTGATAVTFGGSSATGITVVNDTTITATTPAHAAGPVAVAVTTPGGNASLPNGFTFAAPVPTIASAAPNTGPATGGTAVTITGTGFTGVTAVTFGGTAATGFTVNSDTSITATTPAHAAGAVAVAVTGPGGNASLPSAFTYAAPVPTVASHTLELLAGTSGTVDLTQGATGGPFTAAAIVTPPPASDGTASITHSGTQWQLVYASTAGAASTVVVRYTLSNASGTSAPGTVTFTVIARPDPSRDPEVIGLLNAQAQSAQRFAKSQITNFRDRLEQLHDDSSREATSMNVRLGIPQDPNDPNTLGYAQENRPYDPTRSAFAYGPDDVGNARRLSGKTPPPKNGSPSDLAFWAGGFVNFGTANKYKIDLGHTLIGVSGGVDYRFSPNFTAGIGFGYGRDTVDVGINGTQSNGQAFSTAIYGSYHPHNNIFVDGLLGYSALDFGSKRFVTPTSGFANGDRSGSQVFGSLSSGYEYRGERFLVSPYGRIEAAWTQLNGFTESGAAPYDLTFGDQRMNMLAGVLGVRTEYAFPQDWGVLKARGRLEYTHDFSGSSWASMGYADLNNGLPYTLNIDAFTRDYVAVGLGFDAGIGNGATIGFDYTTAFGFDGNTQAHNFALRFGAKF